MNSPWRLFLVALRFVTRGDASPMATPGADAGATPAQPNASGLVPLAGIVVGLIGAGTYWMAAQLWPTSIAVILAMLAMTLTTTARATRGAGTGTGMGMGMGMLYDMFVLFIKYNALMALSAANLPVPLPPFIALGLIMVAAQAGSHALLVSVMSHDAAAALEVTHVDLAIALFLGFAPAALLGIPGLIGLVTAIIVRLSLTAHVLPRLRPAPRDRLDIVQSLTEVSFYLGALASWRYV